ncbi:CpsD/CapB family tyrosine-protein kinase [Caldibacillus lycopersici]|uniref:non-specific protein-tyrosine kinase n=1 Tax=Perspicuibacillus lycopersici TaxID=1325689 RepID=A0AAE3IW69_9BACI|nr:CpsD/CapB family tyrosine-protein kinase [Perspicuibacillus lycopersici]MCU9613200.1 CpsD/CapB family tyrosine-protein kinase [Perspicuibacillus lycopersici]
MAKTKTNKHTRTKNRLISKLAPKSPITEQYRNIRTNIQYSSVDADLRSITVTSTAPGEGKTTTISNLAVVFAQQGKKVLLVDADLRRPQVHFVYQLPNTLGLTNVLTKQVELVDAIRETDIPELFILTSGPIPPNPAELLGSTSMDHFIAEAYKHFDLILFDAPPILAVSDAHVMANQTDGSLLVISSGTTDREAAVKAKEILTNAKSKLLGAILNNKPEDKNLNYYYYGKR